MIFSLKPGPAAVFLCVESLPPDLSFQCAATSAGLLISSRCGFLTFGRNGVCGT